MAHSKVEVNLPGLSSVIKEMETAQGTLQQQIRDTYESITELNSMWTGTAAATFQSRAGKDHEIMQSCIDELKKLTGLYRQASKDYQTCESKVASAVASIKV